MGGFLSFGADLVSREGIGVAERLGIPGNLSWLSDISFNSYIAFNFIVAILVSMLIAETCKRSDS